MKVALTGFMGAGKTTVGEQLAKRLQMPFVEIDVLIPRYDEPHRRSIPEIFAQSGEAEFRRIENEVWEDTIRDPRDLCISTGGGLIIQEQNYKAVEGIQDLCLIYLSAKFETLEARLVADRSNIRPLADNPAQLEKLYHARESLYKARSHLVIEVDGKTVDEVVQEAWTRILDTRVHKS